MPDREKVIEGLVFTLVESSWDADRAFDEQLMIEAVTDAITLLKAQEQKGKAYWIPCHGKSHIWYCSNCGEKINYNDARRTYQKEKKLIESVNRFCRGCGAKMTSRPTDAQREAVPWI